MKELTAEEQNFIKDILCTIGRDDELNSDFASYLGMSEKEFDKIGDSVFDKLQNGRLTIEED